MGRPFPDSRDPVKGSHPPLVQAVPNQAGAADHSRLLAVGGRGPLAEFLGLFSARHPLLHAPRRAKTARAWDTALLVSVSSYSYSSRACPSPSPRWTLAGEPLPPGGRSLVSGPSDQRPFHLPGAHRSLDVLKDFAPGSQLPILLYDGEAKTDTLQIEEFLEETLGPPE